MYINRITGLSSSSTTSSTSTTSTTTVSSSLSSAITTSSSPSLRRSTFNRKSLLLPDILRDTEKRDHLRGLCTPPPSPLYQLSFFNRSPSNNNNNNNSSSAQNIKNINNINNNMSNNNNNNDQRSQSNRSLPNVISAMPIDLELIREVGHSLRLISDAFDKQHSHKALFSIIVILQFSMYF
uniref:Uncharacterized protein n=1 Tax=Tetranychus urticae TaxID=32264 RepID=T1JVB1_TETUR